MLIIRSKSLDKRTAVVAATLTQRNMHFEQRTLGFAILLYEDGEPRWQPMTLQEAEIFCSGLRQAYFNLEEAELVWSLLDGFARGEAAVPGSPGDRRAARVLANRLAPEAGMPEKPPVPEHI